MSKQHEQMTELERCVCADLCACTEERNGFGFLKSLTNLVKLYYSNPKNIEEPSLKCYAADGPSQLDVRIVEAGDLQQKLQKPDNYPAIIGDYGNISYSKLALGNNIGVDDTKSREALGNAASMGVTLRHVVKNPADLLALAGHTYELVLSLGVPMLEASGVKRVTMGAISKTGPKIPIPDGYFGVDLTLTIEYIHAVVRVNQAHRIAGFFTSTTH
jgi:hypothetical protein